MAIMAKCFFYSVFSLLSFAAICALRLTPPLAAESTAIHLCAFQHESENGIAAVTYPVGQKKDFVFSARLELPEVRNNQSWYCVWIMVAELKPTSPHPSMLQVGLMRWDQSNFQTQPFITTEQTGKELMFKPVAGILKGYHRFEIAGDSSTIELKMDGEILMSALRAGFFKDGSAIYLKMASEVFAVGDTASGLVNNVTLVTDGDKEETPISYAAFEDRGLKFLCKGTGQWEATGLFDPKLRFVQYVPPVCR
ncbi:MAG: hypothetical protein ACYDC3_00065 [Candidatus Binataceae bacterium]